MKMIPLTQGKFATVDDCDYDLLSKYKWRAQKARSTWYAWGKIKGGNKPIYTKMHRMIMNTPSSLEVDHRDMDGLNNTRNNLRNCTRAQNSMNRGLFANNTSGFKGVIWNKHRRKWKAQIYLSGKSVFLGYFFCIIKAAKAYNDAALRYYGEFAWLNSTEAK